MVALPSLPFPCPFFPAGCREKTGHRNGFGVYRPHRQRFPVGNRLILVVLGLSGPSRLAAVWWISPLSSHLRLKNLLSAWPPFLIPEIGAAWCHACCRCGPDVSCDEEPPCFCDLVSLCQCRSDLRYTNPEKIISTHGKKLLPWVLCLFLIILLILFAFSTIIYSTQMSD